MIFLGENRPMAAQNKQVQGIITKNFVHINKWWSKLETISNNSWTNQPNSVARANPWYLDGQMQKLQNGAKWCPRAVAKQYFGATVTPSLSQWFIFMVTIIILICITTILNITTKKSYTWINSFEKQGWTNQFLSTILLVTIVWQRALGVQWCPSALPRSLLPVCFPRLSIIANCPQFYEKNAVGTLWFPIQKQFLLQISLCWKTSMLGILKLACFRPLVTNTSPTWPGQNTGKTFSANYCLAQNLCLECCDKWIW